MKKSNRIRLSLFGGSVIIILIVLVFLWFINSNQASHMLILGTLAIVFLGFFFAFGQVFDQNGHIYTSRIMTMLVCILMIVQMASAFLAYTIESVNFSFNTFDHAFSVVDKLDSADEGMTESILRSEDTEYFSYLAVADPDGRVISSSNPKESGDVVSDKDALSFVLYSGNRLIAKPSEEYSARFTRELITNQLTLLVISLMFSVEFVMYIVTRVSKKDEENTSSAPPILGSVRQTAFLFYFASRLSASFIPVMAKNLPSGGLDLPPNVIAALPQTVETFFTCISILFTNRYFEKKGWKPPFVLGLSLVLIGTLGCAFFPSLALFTLSRAFIGFGYGFCWMTLRTIALFGKGEQERSLAFAMLNAGLFAGMYCGSTAGSLIAATYGNETVLLVSAVLIGICGINIISMENNKLPKAQVADRVIAKIKKSDLAMPILFIILMIAPSCIVVAYSGYFLPVFYDQIGRGVLSVGRVQLLYGLIIVYLGPVISRHIGGRPAAANCLYNGLLAAALILLGLLGDFQASVIAMAMIAVADGFGFGVQNNYYLALPFSRRLGDGKALMYLSLLKKLMEMFGPAVFALAMSSAINGILGMGMVFTLCVVVFAAFSALALRKKAKEK